MSRAIRLIQQTQEGLGKSVEGWLLYGAAVQDWLGIAQGLGCKPQQLEVHAFSHAGQQLSFVVFQKSVPSESARNFPLGQAYVRLGTHCFIPADAGLSVPMTKRELENSFGESDTQGTQSPSLWHPQLGLLRLPEMTPWSELIILPKPLDSKITAPNLPKRIPLRIGSIHVESDLKTLEERLEATEPNDDLKPLSPRENLLRNALKRALQMGGTLGQKAAQRLAGDEDPQELLEKLERRNGDEIERLRKLYENNPLEALKHSMPLDTSTMSNLGNLAGAFSMSKFWSQIGLRAFSSGSGRGSAGLEASQFEQLQKIYEDAFENLSKKGEHEQAAFVLLKLLNNPKRAADYLKANHLYIDAADLFERKLKDKSSAAVCYELGRDFSNARRLYEENHQLEKAGDCAHAMGDDKGAFTLWQRQVTSYRNAKNPLASAKLLRSKLQDEASANNELQEGFRQNQQAVDCLVKYLAELSNSTDRIAYLERLRIEIPNRNLDILKGLAKTYKRGDLKGDEEQTKPLALSLAADTGKQTSAALLLLSTLVKDDPEFGVDIHAFLAHN